jgi:hypothetical protein
MKHYYDIPERQWESLNRNGYAHVTLICSVDLLDVRMGSTVLFREPCLLSSEKDAVIYRDMTGKMAPGKESTSAWCREWNDVPAEQMPDWAIRIKMKVNKVARARSTGDRCYWMSRITS